MKVINLLSIESVEYKESRHLDHYEYQPYKPSKKFLWFKWGEQIEGFKSEIGYFKDIEEANNNYIVIDKELHTKPKLVLKFISGEEEHIVCKTNEEAIDRFNSYCRTLESLHK